MIGIGCGRESLTRGVTDDLGVARPARTISLINPDRTSGANAEETRPWIGVRFMCSGAYVRVYRNVQGTGYTAGCPKCGRQMRFRVAPGGTDKRFFEVSC